MEKLMLKGQ